MRGAHKGVKRVSNGSNTLYFMGRVHQISVFLFIVSLNVHKKDLELTQSLN